MKQISVRVDDELLAAIETARGDVPRERWIRRACEQALTASAPAEDAPAPPREEKFIDVTGRRTRVGASVKRHHPKCDCPVCKPPKEGKR